MEIDNLFVSKYDALIIDRLKAAGIYGERQEAMKCKIYERILESDNYDPKRGKITTWLWNLCRGVISNELRKEKNSQDVMDNECVSFDSTGAVIGQEEAGTAADELDRLFKITAMSARNERMIRDYYLNNCNLKDLAVRYSMNNRAVEQVIYRSMKALRENAEG